MASYYERIGEHRFLPCEPAGGAWSPDEQHIAPLTGLIVHEIERATATAGALVTARIGVDILGRLPMGEFDLHVEVLRPGRTIELVEAVVTAGGRPAARARVWRIAGFDTAAVAGGQADPLPDPATLTTSPPSELWQSDFLEGVRAVLGHVDVVRVEAGLGAPPVHALGVLARPRHEILVMATEAGARGRCEGSRKAPGAVAEGLSEFAGAELVSARRPPCSGT